MRARTYLTVFSAMVLCLVVPVASGSLFSNSFTVAEPRSGDSGLYAPGSIVVDGEVEDTEGLRFAFELGSWTERVDAYGVERELVPFRTYAVAEDQALELPWTSWVSARGAPGLVHELDMPEVMALEMDMVTFANRHQDPWGAECFFLTGLQGETVREGVTLPLGEMCGEDLPTLAAEHDVDVEVEVAEVVTLEEGGQAARFLFTLEAPGEGGVVMDVWYKEAIPYPVELNLEAWVATDHEPGDTGETIPLASAVNPFEPWFHAIRDDQDRRAGGGEMAAEASIRLERFHRGNGGIVPEGGLPEWPSSNTLLEPDEAVRWGPPGGEDGFPYLHEEAVDAILNDPTLVGFQAWWEESPSARAFTSSFEERVTETERAFVWAFDLVRDDGEAYRVESKRTVEARGPGEGLLDAPVPVIENEAQAYDARMEPDLEAFPSQLPRIPSVIDTWERLDPETAQDEGANAFRWTHPLAPEAAQAPVEAGWKDPGDGEVSFFDWGETYSLVHVHPDDGAIMEHDRQNVEAVGSWMGTGVGGSSPGWSGMEFFGTSDGPAALDAPVVVGIATASTLALLALVVFKMGLGIPLYSRLTRGELLDHPTRRRVYDALEASPGRSLRELAKAAGCAASTVRYHLDRLEREGLVASAGDQGTRRWFPSGSMDQAAMEAHVVLSVGDTAKAFEAIQDDPGASLSEVADTLGTSPPAAHKIVDRLIEAGLVEKTREGRSIALHPAREVEGSHAAL